MIIFLMVTCPIGTIQVGEGGYRGGLAGGLLSRGWDNETSVQNTYPCAISNPGQWNRSAQVVEDVLIKKRKKTQHSNESN